MNIRFRSRRFVIALAIGLIAATLLIAPAVIYAAGGTESQDTAALAIPAATDTGPTQFSNPHPAVGTNNPIEPISINYSDPDGVHSTNVEMWFDDYWVTKCYSVGVQWLSGGMIWDHTRVTEWGTGCKTLAAEQVPMSDGPHTVYMEATDLQGNLTTYSWDFVVDKTPPDIVPPDICGQLFETGAVGITYGYGDPVTGIDVSSVAMTIDGIPVTPAADASQAQYTTGGLADGEHTVDFAVSDQAGNQKTHSCNFITDTQPPVIGTVSPAPDSRVVAVGPVIQAEWSDAGAGIDQNSAQMKIDGVDVIAGAAAATYGISYQASNLGLGDHTVWVSVADNTGKASSYEWSFTRAETISYYAPWYDSLPQHNMKGNWVLVSNQEDTDAAVAIYIGGQPMVNPDYKPVQAFGAAEAVYGGAAGAQYTFIVPAHGKITPQFPNMIGGPVRVVSLDAKELLVSQRVLYGDSFNEVMAVREIELDNDYYFTWYDSLPQNNMRGNWILVGNVSEDAAAEVYISIDGQPMLNPNWQQDGAADQYSYRVDPGGIITPSYAGTIGGPVRVTCTNCADDHNLIVSQRVLYGGSFSEVMGMPASQLDTEYYFTWYDSLVQNGMRGNWVLMGNTSPITVADVYVEIAGKRRLNPLPGAPNNEHFYIPPGSAITPVFPNTMDGPVHVVCNNCSGDMKIYSSQRVLYRDSFEEVQGTSPAQMGSSAVFTWYDMQSPGMIGNWVLVGNQSNAAVHVYMSIGGQNATGPDPLVVAAFDNQTPTFPGFMGGPVDVVCQNCNQGQKIIVSQRVIYKNSFNEVVGHPPY